MGINKEKLASIISGRARALCSVNGDKLVSEKISNKNTTNYDPDPSSFTDYEQYDKLYLSESSNYSNELEYNNDNIQNSNLPQHIKESLAKQKISLSNDGLSVLDELGIKPQQKQIKETKLAPIQSNPQIDYTIIKAIVNECLKEYFDKKPLNESANLQTIGLQNGNISLVDNKGNIYKAKLEKIGNKNKQ